MSTGSPIESGRPCIGLISSCPHLANVPILTSIIEKLVEVGYEVRVFAPSRHDLGEHALARHVVYKGNPWAFYGYGPLRPLGHHGYLRAWALRERLRHRYRALIIVDSEALEMAARWGLGLGIPGIYCSLELLVDKDIPISAQTVRRWHRSETRLLPDYHAYIVPDSKRGQILAAEHALSLDKMVCIPNSWRNIPLKPKSGILKKTFGLSTRDRIVIYAGNIGPGFGIEDILASVNAWPAHWKLVLHSSFGPRVNPRIAFELNLLRSLVPPGRVLIPNPDLVAAAYWEMLRDADAGIAFYTPNGDEWGWLTNNQMMGYASGKINAYLRAGLPVITNGYTNLGEMLVVPEQAGFIVKTAADIGPALQALEPNYNSYAVAARQAYEKWLDPEPGLDQLISAICTWSRADSKGRRRLLRFGAAPQQVEKPEFPHDPVGLAAKVAGILANAAGKAGPANREEVKESCSKRPIVRRVREGLRRFCMDADEWRNQENRRRCTDAVQLIRERGRRNGRPVLAYVVPFDVMRLQTGGGRRISGIARALQVQFEVFILSLSPASRMFSLKEIHPRVWMLAIPASPEFEVVVREMTSTAADAAPLFGFASRFSLLPDYHSVMEALASVVKAWVAVTPAVWKPLQSFFNPGRHQLVYDVHDDFLRFLTVSLRCREPDWLERASVWEHQLISAADCSVFCTHEDAKTMQARYPDLGTRFRVVPNGVDVAASIPVWPSAARLNRRTAGLGRDLVVFTGANYRPNQEAVDWLVRELAPALPNVVFAIIGMRLDQFRAAGGPLPGDNVVFTGPVSEKLKDAIFSLADIALAPMFTGTGSSLKIPDYLAHGKIVVGTPTGFRGFTDLSGQSSVVITQNITSELARMLAELEQAPEGRDASCRAVRTRVQETLDWSIAARPLLQFFAAGQPDVAFE